MLKRSAMEKLTQMLCNQLSEDLYRDPDPENTEWQYAVRQAMKCYRKRRRAFFKLWLECLAEARTKHSFTGLSQVYSSSTTFSGGDGIRVPISIDKG